MMNIEIDCEEIHWHNPSYVWKTSSVDKMKKYELFYYTLNIFLVQLRVPMSDTWPKEGLEGARPL